jgi:hypothetical protein
MSTHVYCWKVQAAYFLTEEQRNNLVESLTGIDGALEECSAWKVAGLPLLPSLSSPFFSITIRMQKLHDALLQLQQPVDKEGCFITGWWPPFKVLRNVIRKTYEGKRPKTNDMPKFPGDDDFYKKHFQPLYYDSLQLRRENVYAYCDAHNLKQVREMKGLMFEDRAAATIPPAVTFVPQAPVVPTLTAGTSFTSPLQPSAEPVVVPAFDALEKENAFAIAAWEAVLPLLRSAELTAAKLAIEKWRGKSHAKAYKAAIPDGCTSRPKEFVSRKKHVADSLAKRHNLPMPCWWSKE